MKLENGKVQRINKEEISGGIKGGKAVGLMTYLWRMEMSAGARR